ncbi:MAG: hypothetical protein ACK5KT_08870 [Dysgonomonas sp.]
MKDENIRKYIDENRDTFDDKEPSFGHIERFEALLNKQETENTRGKTARRSLFIRTCAIAASIAILIGVAVKFYAPQSIEVVPNEKGIEINEFQATNDYYNQQMEAQIADIMCKLAYTDNENQAQLSQDLEKIIDSNKSFVSEMAKNENKGMALRYLVKHYKANIQALENINEKLGKYTKC